MSTSNSSHGGGMHSHGNSMHGGHGGGMPAVAPPGVGASAAQIASFLSDLAALPEMHMHEMGGSMMVEHMALMDLVPRSTATHVAIGDGDWSDPAIWSGGQVPGNGANVLIPEGVVVNYDAVSDARIFTLRVDGELDFETQSSTQLIFDTFVVGTSGKLTIGTADDPVRADVNVDLIVAGNGAIDTLWDPMLLSRGIVSHGAVEIHGAAKDSHEKVSTDPMAGDTWLQFDAIPQGWQVGDTIVIAGTRYDGYKWDNDIRATRYFEGEDEVREITGIGADGRVFLDAALTFDHDTPRADLKTSVANMSRSVTVESENGENSALHERGHIMFMHSDDVDVRYAAFDHLGRTDKSTDSFSTSSLSNIEFDSNVQGRYSLHLHQTGTEDLNNPAILEGNSVFGAPGWGIVHHDANALITNNATFDTFGAGYIAETGNETGAWIDNIAILAQGQSWDDPKNQVVLNTFDTARSGDGFWFQGRMVASQDNIAASVNNGFTYFHRDGDNRMISFGAELFDFPDALFNGQGFTAHETPIISFSGNEAFAAREGLHVVKANPNQGHDVWSRMEDFTAWSVANGVHLEYTSHYILENFDLIGKEDTGFSPSQTGIEVGNNTSELVVINSTVDNFGIGVDFHKSFDGNVNGSPDRHDFVLVDVDITNTAQTYFDYDPALDTVTSRGALNSLALNLNLEQINFGSGQYGGTAIRGIKEDGLGTVDFPGGTDNFQISAEQALTQLETGGFWRTGSGEAYFLVDVYFTDRLTGEFYFETHPVFVNAGTANGFGNGGYYGNVAFNGVQDITQMGAMRMAGDVMLDVATQAVQNGGFSLVDVVQGHGGGHGDGGHGGGHGDGGHGGGHGDGGHGGGHGDGGQGGGHGDGGHGAGHGDGGQGGGMGSGPMPMPGMIMGGAGADRLFSTQSNDMINGGGGVDTAVFSGNQANFTLTLGPSGTTLTDRSGTNGTDQLTGVEFLDFDTTIGGAPFDLGLFGGLATVSAADMQSFVELYIATFNRAPDALGLSFWGTAFANGTSLSEMAALFMDQPETLTTYPSGISNVDFATSVYMNVLGRVPDVDGFTFWVGVLQSGQVTRDQFILEVIAGAKAAPTAGASASFVAQQQADQAFLADKTDIGTYFAVTRGLSDVENAQSVMALFNGSQGSLNAAVAATDALFAEASSPNSGEFLMPIVGILDDPFA